MRSSPVLALAACLLSITSAIQLVERQDGSPAVLALDTQRKYIENPLLRDRIRRELGRRGLQKRQSTLQATLDNEETLYFVNVTLGTPGQSLRLDIDTGSSDLWCNSAQSDLCSGNTGACAESGTYNANASSTYEYLNGGFYIRYADNSQAQGDYVSDTLGIAGTDIENVQFGVGYQSTSQQGILGVGYATNEVSATTLGSIYPNLPQILVDRGTIRSNAYSLWLNDLDANTGSILFGGVDTAKYHGSLQTVPVIPEQGAYREFVIAMTGLTANGGDNLLGNDAIGVLLDSGTSLSYLPNNIASSLYSTYNAQYSESEGLAQVDCDLANSDGSLVFTFSGIDITVPLNELVLVAAIQRGQPICVLGIAPSGGSTTVLGDTFLRSAYVVYDLANNEISLASTNFNATSSSIREIGTGSNAVPDATAVPNAVSTVAVGTGGARAGEIPSATGLTAGAAPRSNLASSVLAAAVTLVAVCFVFLL